MTPWTELRCPESGVALHPTTRIEAERSVFAGRPLRSRTPTGYSPVGPTDDVFVREDAAGAYPVVDGIPVLRVPELLVPGDVGRCFNIEAARYAEAYGEMAYYDEQGASRAEEVASTAAAGDLRRIIDTGPEWAASFPDTHVLWLYAKYELPAQRDAYRHLRPLLGARVLQLGGSGLHAVKFLLAGAEEAWLVSPMVGEVQFARALAEHCGVGSRLRGVAALSEELPFAEGFFDAIYSQGCVHHRVTDLALPECHRVLRPGGRFSAVEPWRAPLYGIGTRLLGKRQREVRCVVLTAPRIIPPMGIFDDVRIIHHGALTRYPLIALSKLGVRFSRRTVWHIGRIDDAIVSHVPRWRTSGSSVAILATRSRAATDIDLRRPPQAAARGSHVAMPDAH